MKTLLRNVLTTACLLFIPVINYAQAPELGSAADFVIFSTNGAVSNTGISQITGNVGTNNGSSTSFGNVNGMIHDADGVSAQCAADLLIAYNQLNTAIPTIFPGPLLGNGVTLAAGVYSIPSAATLNLDLTLDAENNPSAVFIFQIGGAFSTAANSKIKLINGALACNVFWKVEGLVDMATGTTMRGTIIVNNFALIMNTGDTLEGRAFSTTGAVTVHGVFAYTPIGCGSPVLNGPMAPDLGAAACYAIFSATGAVTNTGETHITGDVGSNSYSPTGYNPSNINGTLHMVPDGSTAQCEADLPNDIELKFPAQLGNNLVLTPHTYLLNAAASLTDSLYLNALGNSNAVFVIKINGALTTGTYAKIKLINGAQAKNVYWMIEGAVNINNYSEIIGTIICHDGALGALNTGVVLNGRALTTAGAITTTAMTAVASILPTDCATVGIATFDAGSTKETVSIYPNPSTGLTHVAITGLHSYTELAIYTLDNKKISAYNISGKSDITLDLSSMTKGMYLLKITGGKTDLINKLILR